MNPKAIEFYESMGFQVPETTDTSQKMIWESYDRAPSDQARGDVE